MTESDKTVRRTARVAVLAGDGIGPEVTAEAEAVLKMVAERRGVTLETVRAPIGGAAIEETGDPYPAETERVAMESDAILFGAVGGPQWEDRPPDQRADAAILKLRKALQLYANLRPLRLPAGTPIRTSLRPDLLQSGLDVLIVRELTGGLYYGPRATEEGPDGARAYDTMVYSEPEIRRLAELGFRLAEGRRGRATLVDKSNVLDTSRLWRKIVTEMAQDHPQVRFDTILIDNCAMQLVLRPDQFDVLMTENMFGDILSDLGAGVIGSIGLLPSASLGAGDRPAVYEPVHGSAPDIAGQGLANPIAAIGSAALLLRHSLQMPDAADAVEAAIDQVLREGPWTADVVPEGHAAAGTQEVGSAVRKHLAKLL